VIVTVAIAEATGNSIAAINKILVINQPSFLSFLCKATHFATFLVSPAEKNFRSIMPRSNFWILTNLLRLSMAFRPAGTAERR
jgi:hypothetical protein